MQRGLGQLQDRLKRDGPPVRWVDPTKVHVTLKFMGAVPAEQIPIVCDCTAQAATAATPFEVEAAGVGVFPNPNRPRVVWVGLQGDLDALRGLQARVEANLAAQGFPTEGRPFSPHLTLGRVRERAAPADVRTLGQAVTRLTVPVLGRWRVEQIVVMRSDLRPTGPIYTPLRVIALGVP